MQGGGFCVNEQNFSFGYILWTWATLAQSYNLLGTYFQFHFLRLCLHLYWIVPHSKHIYAWLVVTIKFSVLFIISFRSP
jgi:hypothetical protein